MHILLTGANGFIGFHLLAGLREAGHTVVAAVRNPSALIARVPGLDAIAVDLNRDTTPEAWAGRLRGIDAVVNCAGILQTERGQSIEAIHHHAPAALYRACLQADVRRVIHISAISADPKVGTAYALSKHRGEETLRALDLDWVILRPSLVYAEGSYGGTSLLRGLAGLPGVIPVVGDGQQPFQPIHVSDVVKTVLVLLARPNLSRVTLAPVGPRPMTLVEILRALRRWLGFKPARLVHVPRPLVRLVCLVGDIAAAGPIRTTSLAQLEHGNAASVEPFAAAIGFMPRDMEAALATHPAQVQDRWHARLFFVRPLLTQALAVVWLGSGVAGLLLPWAESAWVLDVFGFSESVAGSLGAAASVLDLVVAALILFGRWTAAVGAIQLAIIAIYTLVLTIALPTLWLDPFGALLKNVPLIGAILAWMAMADDR